MFVLTKFQFSPENSLSIPFRHVQLVYHIGTQKKQCICTKKLNQMQQTSLLPGLRAAILTLQINKL